ncbi:BlaI/MecI/CopY family transcriptional regulator [Pontibacter sp. G13]|uniref:BlaI/MecI/CopY family transcriptional regulator n=1 Tax=Pontibacter sp. G13 TaxID=3074898 RepID=UPI002889E057|nr:BlaI/MecI/CopY family transcriptional regulator [Pontibacter sp. G13]WNJ19731.1 BlaI/MecI/CopY family transcriptional regulator [Pontibacter sp. G13]
MQKLTKAEENLMQIIWEKEAVFLRDLMDALPDPKPSQSTVSTVIRILKDKGFIDFKAFGKSYQYYPIVSKDDYAKEYLHQFLDNYFGGSFRNLLSFFAKEENLDLHDIDALLKNLPDSDSPTES